MRQAWDDGVATLDGKHYQVDGAICRPLPLQAGGIPLWIAGGGEKKTLRIAAQYADVHQLRRHARGLPAQVARSSPSTAATSGRDFDEIIRSANYNVVIGATEAEVDRPAAGVRGPAAALPRRRRRSRRPCEQYTDRPAGRHARADRRAARPSCRTPA